ncbi:hypothetical protein [Shimia sediminis]|uniref:hypothetical protein n=1 Tax=Shimia sediminis TaxID=2497945 RepID=UPI0013E02D46|nr:hypothetical protein [Shimia sediminis]
MTKLFSALAVAMALAAPASAQTWSSNAPQIGPVNQPEGVLIQAYPASTNYCQTGYQPVVVGGVICCGKPNASYTPASYSAPQSCPAGTKGCS